MVEHSAAGMGRAFLGGSRSTSYVHVERAQDFWNHPQLGIHLLFWQLLELGWVWLQRKAGHISESVPTTAGENPISQGEDFIGFKRIDLQGLPIGPIGLGWKKTILVLRHCPYTIWAHDDDSTNWNPNAYGDSCPNCRPFQWPRSARSLQFIQDPSIEFPCPQA